MAELLSDLCSICHDNKSKYRCPGCAARTCSLPCSKRHKQRAGCSGKRDPTKYVKKSQLATAAGIDHDFNFIAAIERKLDRAERDAEENALNITANGSRVPGHHGFKLTQQRLAQSGVTVEKAPKGISRQKANKSRLSHRKQIIWSLEWIYNDQGRELNESGEWCTISEAHQRIVNSRNDTSVRKKRKRKQLDQTTAIQALDQDATSPPGDDAQAIMVQVHAQDEEGIFSTLGSTAPGVTGSEEDSKVEGLPHPRLDSNEPDSKPVLHDAVATSTVSEIPPPDFHFYLHKPRTTTMKIVLIPISPDATLSETLKNRTVLEFPTIYVLSFPPDSLPPQYQLESEYLEQAGKEQKEFEDLLSTVYPEGLQALRAEEGADDQGKSLQDELDSKKILDVLKRDVTLRS